MNRFYVQPSCLQNSSREFLINLLHSTLQVCAYDKGTKFKLTSKYFSENFTIALYLNSNFPVKKKVNRLFVRPSCLQNRALSAVHTLELCGTICNVFCGPVYYKN